MTDQDWVFWLGFACGISFTVIVEVAHLKYKEWRARKDCTCGLMHERKDDDREDGG